LRRALSLYLELATLLSEFLPATPSSPRSLLQVKQRLSMTPSPCCMLAGGGGPTPVPSPTPFFHQLYAAVACLERELSPVRARSRSVDGPLPRLSPGALQRMSLDLSKLPNALSTRRRHHVAASLEPSCFSESSTMDNLKGDVHQHSASDSDGGKHDDVHLDDLDWEPEQTPYIENEEEEFGSVSSNSQNKSSPLKIKLIHS
jgi:hypothetical protein